MQKKEKKHEEVERALIRIKAAEFDKVDVLK